MEIFVIGIIYSVSIAIYIDSLVREKKCETESIRPKVIGPTRK